MKLNKLNVVAMQENELKDINGGSAVVIIGCICICAGLMGLALSGGGEKKIHCTRTNFPSFVSPSQCSIEAQESKLKKMHNQCNIF